MNIYQKLIEVRKEVPYLKKENDGSQYKYVSSSQVLGNLKAKMDELGVLLIPMVTGHKVTESVIEYHDKDGNVSKRTTTYFTEIDFIMTWVNAEKPDETIPCSWYGQGVDIAGEKGVGKAMTYAEKYFMLKFFNIPTDKDDPDSFQDKITGEGDKNKPTDAQIKEMFDIGAGKGYTQDEIKTSIFKAYKKTNPAELTKSEYDTVCNNLKNAQKKGVA